MYKITNDPIPKWEEEAYNALVALQGALHMNAGSENMSDIQNKLLDVKLRIALQTGHFEAWGL